MTRRYDGGDTGALRALFSELELTRLLAQLQAASPDESLP